jgi:hypothetical protein
MKQGITVAQSNTISLSTPYYGNETITAYFDHKYPTYDNSPNDTYTRTVRYDGIDTPSCEWVCYDGHNGTDFSLTYARVLAAADGIVTNVGWDVPGCHGPPDARFGCGYGLYIDIAHDNGYVTRYGHLGSIAVESGDEVYQGQVIGSSGNTGNSTGPHLHFGVYLNGTAVDPFGWDGWYPDPWLQYSGVTSHLLWGSGEWAGEALPHPQYTTVINVDDEDLDEFSAGCLVDEGYSLDECPFWYEQTGVGAWNDMWWTFTINAVESDYWAEWKPNIASAGFYNILVSVPSNHATSWQADFRVKGANGILHHTIVDQYGIYGFSGDMQLTLGTHYLTSESYLQSVWVDSSTGEAYSLGRTLGIDQVSFLRQETGQVYLPIVINQ